MNIKSQHWRSFVWIGSIIAVPAALYLFFRPVNAPIGSLTIVSWAVLLLLGLSGAAVAVLKRAGVVVFSYSERDKQRWDYQLAKNVAEREQSSGRQFAPSYYESFDLRPPESKRP